MTVHIPSVENVNVDVEQGKDVLVHLFGEDDQGHSLRYEITNQPKHGGFAIDPETGHLQYRSNSSYVGHDLISYIAIDDLGNESIQADIFIDVRPLNSPRTVEIAVEIPVKPTSKDIIEAFGAFIVELSDLVNGEQAQPDSGV